MQNTTIHVGLNDAVTHKQEFGTEKYLSILKNVCRSYRVAFSVHTVDGGYFHEDGTYVEETTLMLMLTDASDETVAEIAKDWDLSVTNTSVILHRVRGKLRGVLEKEGYLA